MMSSRTNEWAHVVFALTILNEIKPQPTTITAANFDTSQHRGKTIYSEQIITRLEEQSERLALDGEGLH